MAFLQLNRFVYDIISGVAIEIPHFIIMRMQPILAEITLR